MEPQAKIETPKEAKPRPPQRAMAAAVEMEIHCAIGSKTIDKAHDIDDRFPAYDEMLAALREVAVLGHGKCTIGKPLADMVRAALSKALEPRS